MGDLFESSNGNFDIQKKHINGKGQYVITSGLTDCGVLGKTDINAKIFDKDTLTVDMFGNVFFRHFKYKLVTHARVFSLKPKNRISENIGLFMATTLHFLNKKFSYENMCSWNKIKKMAIYLPIKNGEIDFEFMENFISELEAYHISELEAYLQATGLSNYKLTLEEQEAIDKIEKIDWKIFKVTDIFRIKNTKNILSSQVVFNSGETPYLCASSENNGVASYITYDKKLIDEGQCVFIGGKTFVVSYQKNDFYSNDSHNLALYLHKENECYASSSLIQLFLATSIFKALRHKYSWGDSISKSKMQSDTFLLPIKLNSEEIDFSYMQTLTSAIQKLVIKDVVLYVNRKIEVTKQVSGQNISG